MGPILRSHRTTNSRYYMVTSERGKGEVWWMWIGQISDSSCAEVGSGSVRVMHDLA